MNQAQIVLPFTRSKTNCFEEAERLIGHAYAESERVTVAVVGVCPNDPQRVLLKRRPGRVVSMPVWLVSAVIREEIQRQKRAA